MKLFKERREAAEREERIALALEEIVLNLKSINAHITLQTRLRQEKRIEPKPMPLPQSIIDAAELLSRKIWLELPDQAKEDLSA